MAWSVVKTWLTGAILTSAELNTYVRDNLNYLKGVQDGSGTDKIPPTALDLTGAASLPIANTTPLPSTPDGAVEVARWRGVDQGNTNTLRVLLRRLTAGLGWQTTAWRLQHDIDGGGNLPAFLELGPTGVTLGVGARRSRFNADGVTVLPAGLVLGGAIDLNLGDTFYTITPANNGTQVKGWDNVTLTTSNGGAGKYVRVDSAGKLIGSGFYESGITAISTGVSATFAHGLGAQPRFVWGYTGNIGTAVSVPITSYGRIGGTAPSEVYWGVCDATTLAVANLTGATMYAKVMAML